MQIMDYPWEVKDNSFLGLILVNVIIFPIIFVPVYLIYGIPILLGHTLLISAVPIGMPIFILSWWLNKRDMDSEKEEKRIFGKAKIH